jgi:hypothetical protein
MIFSLDVRRARKGDCLLLHFGTGEQPGLVVIDGGPKAVYGPHLKPRLQEIRAARGLDGRKPLPVDLLMVSHVDDDHIQGILDLTREMIAAQMARQPQALQVLGFWHNSFDNIIGNDSAALTAAFTSQFGAASTAGELPADLTVDVDEDEETIVASLKVLASIEQGARLRGDAERLDFPANPQFGGGLVMARENGRAVAIGSGLTFTVAGPMRPELEQLHRKHEAWLIEQQAKPPHDALAAYVDKSVPNLSSIVVVAEAGGRRMLLTGDARGDKILQGLQLVGLLKDGGTMHVDVLKVPHHGSANNLDDDFFERITADHYVFSGDGEHGNPEREALEMLLRARRGADYAIHLTYPVEQIDAARKDDWTKEQTKEKKKRERNPAKRVRPDWSAEQHGLAALFEEDPGLAAKVRVVDARKPHVIDLLDPLGY